MFEQFRFAGTVANAFNVPKRGLVIMPQADFTVHIGAGSRIQLRTQDHHTIETDIQSIEMVTRQDLPCAFALLLSSDIAPSAVPEGTEIWVLAD